MKPCTVLMPAYQDRHGERQKSQRRQHRPDVQAGPSLMWGRGGHALHSERLAAQVGCSECQAVQHQTFSSCLV